MKRGVIGKLFLGLILLVVLSSGIFACAPGTCQIIPRGECASAGNYIVMGLSSVTNAHGQFPDTGNYPYVLCCAFGTGNTTCTTGPSNKILGLSSATNAHGESPGLSNYLTKVCYGDLQCIGTTTSCPVNNPLGVLSLSSDTNAHIGNFNDYSTKICCGGHSILAQSCKINSASWNTQNAVENQTVYLNVTGSGAECDGVSLVFEIKGPSPTRQNATPVTFGGRSAMSSWKAEWQQASFLGGDASYKFNVSTRGVSIKSSVISSSPDLTVHKTNIVEECSAITTCSDYTEEAKCHSDSCNAGKESSFLDCNAAGTTCMCLWDSSSGTCGFSYSQVVPLPCESGYTLCQDEQGIGYCYPKSSCPVGPSLCPVGTTVCLINGVTECRATCTTPPVACNLDTHCDPGEGCTCSDCSGKQDDCQSGLTCSGTTHVCTGTTPPLCPVGTTVCLIGGINECRATCTTPPVACNLDTHCDPGEGCTCSDCNGQQDDCQSGLTCSGTTHVCTGTTTNSCNYDTHCDPGEGCTCSDCNGQQDSCVSGATCSGGTCYSANPTPIDIKCDEGYTLCRVANTNYCRYGSSCPVDEPSACNLDGKCDPGEGCTCGDCSGLNDGQQDSCVSGTSCLLGTCSSVQNTIIPGADSCKLTQTVIKTCDEGSTKTLKVTGVWTGEQSGAGYEACVAERDVVVPCPAQIQLPFGFSFYIVIALLIIALIYVFLISKKKSRKKKK